MKLAEALILRADCQKRITQLQGRLHNNAKVQEGDMPSETPQELLAELGRISSELLDLIKRINKTNSATVFAGRGTISDVLAERDVLRIQRSVYVDLAQAGAITQDRYTRSEVRYIPTINVAEIQKRADELAKNYRVLIYFIWRGWVRGKLQLGHKEAQALLCLFVAIFLKSRRSYCVAQEVSSITKDV